MTPRTAFVPAASWTHTLDSEQKQEHDFSNMLSELGYAVRRDDKMMLKFCEGELKRMFRERKPSTSTRRRQSDPSARNSKPSVSHDIQAVSHEIHLNPDL